MRRPMPARWRPGLILIGVACAGDPGAAPVPGPTAAPFVAPESAPEFDPPRFESAEPVEITRTRPSEEVRISGAGAVTRAGRTGRLPPVLVDLLAELLDGAGPLVACEQAFSAAMAVVYDPDGPRCAYLGSVVDRRLPPMPEPVALSEPCRRAFAGVRERCIDRLDGEPPLECLAWFYWAARAREDPCHDRCDELHEGFARAREGRARRP